MANPGRNGERDIHGETRSNQTHASTTDPDAKLYRKGNGLVVGATLTQATGTAEREAALALVDGLNARGRITLTAAADNLVRRPKRMAAA